MEETKEIKNKPKRKELMEQIERLKSELSSAKWYQEYAEKKNKRKQKLKSRNYKHTLRD